MQIIPAIDIINGKCVRLTQGDYTRQTIYNEDPLEVALRFEESGLSRIHLVDLDGARDKRVRNWKVLESLASRTGLAIDFGGGITSEEDLRVVFDSGAMYATIGSIAVKNEFEFGKWLLIHGAGRFLLGADVRDEKIAIHGWTEDTQIDVIDFIGSNLAKGVSQVFCTDISKDGKLEGPSTPLYKKILDKYPTMNLIASGGVSSLRDLELLRDTGCSGAIVGKAIYENKISLKQLRSFN